MWTVVFSHNLELTGIPPRASMWHKCSRPDLKWQKTGSLVLMLKTVHFYLLYGGTSAWMGKLPIFWKPCDTYSPTRQRFSFISICTCFSRFKSDWLLLMCKSCFSKGMANSNLPCLGEVGNKKQWICEVGMKRGLPDDRPCFASPWLCKHPSPILWVFYGDYSPWVGMELQGRGASYSP